MVSRSLIFTMILDHCCYLDLFSIAEICLIKTALFLFEIGHLLLKCSVCFPHKTRAGRNPVGADLNLIEKSDCGW